MNQILRCDLLTTFVQSRWLEFGFVLVCELKLTSTLSRSIKITLANIISCHLDITPAQKLILSRVSQTLLNAARSVM